MTRSSHGMGQSDREGPLDRAALAFWERVGGDLPFPRDLEEVVGFGYSLAIRPVPHLRTKTVEEWLQRKGFPDSLKCHDRDLSACLVTFGESGMIFLCSDDPPEERRFSVAHETAHFLVDCLEPRRRSVEALGPAVLDVLDGRRSPTLEERLSAIVQQAPIGRYVNLMPRGDGGEIASGAVIRAEERADWLAIELLAPRRDLLAALSAEGVSRRDRAGIAGLIARRYGLPARIAAQYAAQTAWTQPESLAEWLGISHLGSNPGQR